MSTHTFCLQVKSGGTLRTSLTGSRSKGMTKAAAHLPAPLCVSCQTAPIDSHDNNTIIGNHPIWNPKVGYDAPQKHENRVLVNIGDSHYRQPLCKFINGYIEILIATNIPREWS